MIRHLVKQELLMLAEFHKREYRPGHILTQTRFLEWQYGGHFADDPNRLSVLGSFSGSTLAGVFGYYPTDFSFFGKTVSGVNLCNLMVKDESRSLGYGALLLKDMMRLGDVTIDHGINQVALPLFQKFGWDTRELARWFFIIDPLKTAELIGGDALRIPAPDVPSAAEVYRLHDRCDESFSDLWSRVRTRYPISIERTATYLNWRYADHPFFNYNLITVSDGDEIRGCAVVRLEEPERHYRVAHVVDFFCEKEYDDLLFRSVIAFCREARVDWVDYFFSGSFHRDACARAGFADGHGDPYCRIPMFLNPIDRTKRATINMATKVTANALDSVAARDPENWYTTKGGGDQDRP